MKYLWMWLIVGMGVKLFFFLLWNIVIKFSPMYYTWKRPKWWQHLLGVVLWPMLIFQFILARYNAKTFHIVIEEVRKEKQ